MHFVLLGVHSAEVCPTSNAKTQELMSQMGPQIPDIAERTGVKLVAGPYANREHMMVVIVESDAAENVDRFLAESRLDQWNTMRTIPSVPMAEAMSGAEDRELLF